MFGKSFRVMLAATALVSVALSAPVRDFAMVDSENFSFDSQLVDAANQNNFSIVKLLLQQGSDPNERGRFETTALQRAAYNGYDNIIDLLIAGGADINAKDFGGATALHMAARQGNGEIVNKLVKAGADIDVKDNEGYSPLHRAVASGNYQVAKILLSARANPDSSSSGGDTPMVDAVRSGDMQLVSLLNSYGANKSQAIDYAIASGDERVSHALSSNEREAVYNDKTPSVQAGPALSSVPENDPFINAANGEISLDSGNIEIPAVVLPNSERAKKIAEAKLPWQTKESLGGYEELVSTETETYEAQKAPQNGFDQLFTDTVERTEQVAVPTEISVSSKNAEINENQLISSDDVPLNRPKSMQNVPNQEEVISNTAPVGEIQIEPTEIRDNADFTDYKSAEYKPINFEPERIPNAVNTENKDGLPASFKYRGLTYQGGQNGNIEVSQKSAYPEFNYQKYQSKELYTSPVQSLQVVNLATKETHSEKLIDPNVGYSQNLQSVDFDATNISMPASMRGGVDNYTAMPQEITYSNDDMSAPLSMTEAYRNIGKTPKVIQNVSEQNMYTATQRPVSGYYNEELVAVPVEQVSQSGEIVDVAASHIVSQPASSETWLPPEYNNVPKENPAPQNLAADINNFYNDNRVQNNLPAPRSMGGYNSSGLNSNSYSPQYQVAPSVQANSGNAPRSMKFWNNVPENKRAALYNKITQQNSPVYTEPKKVAVKSASSSENVLISIEPVSEVAAIEESVGAKVPEVAVQEESIETLETPAPEPVELASASEMEKEVNETTKKEEEKLSTEAPVQPNVPELPELTEMPAVNESEAVVPSENTPIVEDVIDYRAANEDVDLTGTHSVIGGFENAEKAVDYFNGISLRLGLLYNYKVVQSKENGKYYIAIGKLVDADSANKVCEVYKSDEVICEVYSNLSYGAKKLSDLSMIESKKVYAMIGEFQTADQADVYFKQYSTKYKVEYKIAQNPDNNLFVLQIGPVFNGGDGKKICDDMKTPEVKCRVALK